MRSMLDDILANVLNSDGSEFTIYNHVTSQYSSSYFFSWSFVEMTWQGSADERDDYLDTIISLVEPRSVTIIAKGDRMKIPWVLFNVCMLPQIILKRRRKWHELSANCSVLTHSETGWWSDSTPDLPQPSQDTVARVIAHDCGFLTHGFKYHYIESICVHFHKSTDYAKSENCAPQFLNSTSLISCLRILYNEYDHIHPYFCFKKVILINVIF